MVYRSGLYQIPVLDGPRQSEVEMDVEDDTSEKILTKISKGVIILNRKAPTPKWMPK